MSFSTVHLALLLHGFNKGCLCNTQAPTLCQFMPLAPITDAWRVSLVNVCPCQNSSDCKSLFPALGRHKQKLGMGNPPQFLSHSWVEGFEEFIMYHIYFFSPWDWCTSKAMTVRRFPQCVCVCVGCRVWEGRTHFPGGTAVLLIWAALRFLWKHPAVLALSLRAHFHLRSDRDSSWWAL